MEVCTSKGTINKRLKALEAKMAQDGIVLTETQLQVLEKRRNEKEVYGKIDTQHPGYLGCQDTYYVGNFKGSVASIAKYDDMCYMELNK